MVKHKKTLDENTELSDIFEWEVDEKSGCFLLRKNVNNHGYGVCKIDGKSMGAHRVSWMIKHKKEIPEGLLVLHGCDVRNCINPDHLRVGTHQDNRNDMLKRHPRYRNRLEKYQIEEILGNKSYQEMESKRLAVLFRVDVEKIEEIRSQHIAQS